MTIVDEIMVLLDDRKVRTLEDFSHVIPTRTKQTISSTLGRLVQKGWVVLKKSKGSRVNRYQIAKIGLEEATKTLRHLKLANDAKIQRWLFIIFNIPEKQRKYRDLLRNRLVASGFARVQNSLWVNACDVTFMLEDLLAQPKLQKYITLIRPKLDLADIKEMSRSLDYDWKSLNRGYQEFINRANNFLANKAHEIIQARLLVFYYAKILSRDPKIPHEFEPANYLRQKAHQVYLELRPLCY